MVAAVPDHRLRSRRPHPHSAVPGLPHSRCPHAERRGDRLPRRPDRSARHGAARRGPLLSARQDGNGAPGVPARRRAPSGRPNRGPGRSAHHVSTRRGEAARRRGVHRGRRRDMAGDARGLRTGCAEAVLPPRAPRGHAGSSHSRPPHLRSVRLFESGELSPGVARLHADVRRVSHPVRLWQSHPVSSPRPGRAGTTSVSGLDHLHHGRQPVFHG